MPITMTTLDWFTTILMRIVHNVKSRMYRQLDSYFGLYHCEHVGDRTIRHLRLFLESYNLEEVFVHGKEEIRIFQIFGFLINNSSRSFPSDKAVVSWIGIGTKYV
ncbi:hypothetical protein LOAG_01681 [Loa loa]|uniref:Uncharacterized protein n=1 Tax=Loa loa TaxID=7209 RepID=A0A1S0UAC7_LOALO|nr:hypothetical protein LOAG_01681 [Loa loa]EFO26810.1 hypothetical protein LOAG_01681 [Loa loa]